MSLGQLQDVYPFFRNAIRRRPATGSYVNGRWVPSGAPVDTAIRVSVQAVENKNREEELEGQHQSGNVSLLSDTSLQAGSRDGEIQPDIVDVDGTIYIVKTVEVWEGFDTVLYDVTADLKP